MPSLKDQQKQRALEAMKAYLDARNPDGTLRAETDLAGVDRQRATLIQDQLRPLLDGYLSGQIGQQEFKSKVDGLSKRFNLWGFKAVKGQMFFNQVVNAAADPAELDAELKAALPAPENEDMARSRIRTFERYVRRIGEQFVEAGGSAYSRPKASSIPYFLSYFWQVQDAQTWPMLYTADERALTELDLWRPSDDLAEDYIAFKHVYEELARVFGDALGRSVGFYFVEHVFWFKVGSPFGGGQPPVPLPPVEVGKADEVGSAPAAGLLESYVPPVVAALPAIAHGDPEMARAAKATGMSLERAFEKHVNAAFTILGYETKLLGQGQGRVPDGVAEAADHSYALIWDAKVRSGAYSFGTDDRAMREYINAQNRALRRRALKNVYYLVVSGSFAEDYDDTIRMLKMETDISEVCLVEAEALVAMVDAKLRAPLEVSLGPDGIQRLFCESGVLSAAAVRDTLG